MLIEEFTKLWDDLSPCRKGYFGEYVFFGDHPSAQRINDNAIDFDLNGVSYDVKVHKSVPGLDKRHKSNNVSLWWYNWNNVDDDGYFPIYIISVKGKTVVGKMKIDEFYNRYFEYLDKKKKKEKRNSDQISCEKAKTILKSKYGPVFKSMFGGKNRILVQLSIIKPTIKKQKDSSGWERSPCLLNSTYEKYDRTICLFYTNKGTAEDPKLVIDRWWVFEHSLPREKAIKYLQEHKASEKFCGTESAFENGLVEVKNEKI